MGKCRRCVNCVDCELWQFYSFGMLKIFVLRMYLKLVLLQEHVLAELRNVIGWVARYPERSRFRVHIGKGVVYVWLSWSPEPPKSYPV